MRNTWLERLEENLDEKLSEFLQANKYQKTLLTKQNQKDQFQDLCLKQEKLKEDAQNHRKELLALAEKIKEWTPRAARARQAGAPELAEKASAHIKELMKDGRRLWEELDQFGIQFKEIHTKILAQSEKTKKGRDSLSEDWEEFETKEELELLKRKNSLNH